MCGFVGIFSPHRRIDTAKIDIHAGTRSIRHRGPDGDGYYIAEDGHYQVGFRRISIIDLDGSDQPIHGADGKRILTGNGEIYNYLELRNQFPNYPYRTRGDMEVVLAAKEALGNEFVHALNGMFSLALYDEVSRELTLVRDPLGVKPLFWARTANGGVGFASEPRALFAAGMLEPAIDITQVPNYLAHGYVPAPNTIFQDVYKLQPGHHLRVGANGGLQSNRYWRARGDERLPNSREGIIEVLSERFRQSVRRQLRSDVPLGALLSGGIDSGLLVATAASQMDRPLKTLSVGFEGADYNELPGARRVAERYGTDHDEVVVDINVAERLLPNVVWHGGEPFNDAALIPNYLVEQEMNRKAKVVLNGTGGDEIFAGYGRYFPLPVERAYCALPCPLQGSRQQY